MTFDALIVVSFGGPEGPDEVMPFLQNVVRGRAIPPERLEKVAEQYNRFGGVSPINEHNRRLVASLRSILAERGRDLPVYWGNRNWYPFLQETIEEMRDDAVERAAAFVTSAYSSYSGCRQYIEDIEAARERAGPESPEIIKLRPFFNHPGFVEPLADGLVKALVDNPDATVLMTAHSVPKIQADVCDYERQLAEVASLVAQTAGAPNWQVVYQSRSGPPGQPWLEPDINDAIAGVAGLATKTRGTKTAGTKTAGTKTVIVVPIGFVSDHMEVVHDLDVVAAQTASNHGIDLVRTPTPGNDPRFVEMVLDLLAEAEAEPQAGGAPEPPTAVRALDSPTALGALGAAPFPCRAGCCPSGR